MFVKPAEGMVIPDPDRCDALPAEGRDVPASDFWMRRLRDGDVVEAETGAEPRAEVKPAADGTATIVGDHPAEPAHEGA
ncbi:MAG TPA: DUF2635 domain-containing protein [Rhodopila sp.]